MANPKKFCRSRLAHEPRSGMLFVFINRNKTMLHTLTYDGTGFWLMTKRLSNHHVTAHKLRKLLCIEKSSEHLGQVLKNLGRKSRLAKSLLFDWLALVGFTRTSC